jgi:hypothetical protein
MKVTAKPAAVRPTGRLVQHLRDDLLSSQTVARLRRELQDELDSVSLSEHAADDDARRDVLERAVRRIWGAPL